jgi:hypothetical protein
LGRFLFERHRSRTMNSIVRSQASREGTGS